jgi:hypothetical protein
MRVPCLAAMVVQAVVYVDVSCTNLHDKPCNMLLSFLLAKMAVDSPRCQCPAGRDCTHPALSKLRGMLRDLVDASRLVIRMGLILI